VSDNEREEVSVEEALRIEIVINQALTDLLVEKGIVTEAELLEKVKDLREEMGGVA
jgi:hypothetical protein